METETNPVEAEDKASATLPETQEVETEALAEDQPIDEERNPIADEEEELELDRDLKLRVPKDQARRLRDGWLRQSDYTRKTQALAEDRKAFEAERQSVVQATSDELAAFARASSIDEKIARYQKLDWIRWQREDPFAAQEAFTEFSLLKDARQQALGELAQLRNQRLSKQQQELARRSEQGRELLAREISGWTDQVRDNLIEMAVSDYGFDRSDVDDIEADPRIGRLLHDLHRLKESERKSKAAQRHVDAQKVQPAASVSARRAPPAGLDDRLSAEEWVRRREDQLRKRGR